MAWSKGELRKNAEADDLRMSPFRQDGVTWHPDVDLVRRRRWRSPRARLQRQGLALVSRRDSAEGGGSSRPA
jgi:hypothetical protein